MPRILSRDRQILRIAMPAIVSNVTVPLLGLIDLAIVGHLGSAAYIAAISIGTMMFNLIYWIFGFIRMGTSGFTSQSLGRHDLPEVMRHLARSAAVAAMIAVALIALQVPLRMLALWLMAPSSGHVARLATTYFHTCIWGAPAVLGLYSLTGWFVGMQNSRLPMLVAITQNVVNIAASLCLVYGLHLKVEGVAAGTLIAQWSGLGVAAVLWWRVYGRRLSPHFRAAGLLAAEALRRFFTVNRDIFLRTVCLVAVNFFITSAGSRQGEDVLAVNTLLMQLFMLYSYFIDGFAYAGEALCGRYYGTRSRAALTSAARRVFVWGAAIGVLFTAAYALGGRGFIALLTDAPSVRSLSAGYLPWILLVPLTGTAAFLFDGINTGCTATRQLLWSTFGGAVVFFAVFFGLPRCCALAPNHVLWLAFILYLVARGVVQAAAFPRMVRDLG